MPRVREPGPDQAPAQCQGQRQVRGVHCIVTNFHEINENLQRIFFRLPKSMQLIIKKSAKLVKFCN